MTAAELHRLLCNLIRTGTVSQVDTATHSVRVSTGDNETHWLTWMTGRAGNTRTWHAPAVGEQVLLLAPGGELDTGIIIGSLYSSANPAPSDSEQAGVMAWPDGAQFSYAPETGTLTVTGVKTITVTAADSVTVNCDTATVKAGTGITFDTPDVTCTQKLTAAELSITQGGELHGAFTGSMTLNGVKPDDHEHGGVESGGSWTKGTK